MSSSALDPPVTEASSSSNQEAANAATNDNAAAHNAATDTLESIQHGFAQSKFPNLFDSSIGRTTFGVGASQGSSSNISGEVHSSLRSKTQDDMPIIWENQGLGSKERPTMQPQLGTRSQNSGALNTLKGSTKIPDTIRRSNRRITPKLHLRGGAGSPDPLPTEEQSNAANDNAALVQLRQREERDWNAWQAENNLKADNKIYAYHAAPSIFKTNGQVEISMFRTNAEPFISGGAFMPTAYTHLMTTTEIEDMRQDNVRLQNTILSRQKSCMLCKATFRPGPAHELEVAAHYKVHLAREAAAGTCPFCGDTDWVTWTPGQRMKHIQTFHRFKDAGTSVVIRACPMLGCQETFNDKVHFPTAETREAHMRSHVLDGLCSIAGCTVNLTNRIKLFSLANALTTHMRWHANKDNVSICPHDGCGVDLFNREMFATFDAMNIHVKGHGPSAPPSVNNAGEENALAARRQALNHREQSLAAREAAIAQREMHPSVLASSGGCRFTNCNEDAHAMNTAQFERHMRQHTSQCYIPSCTEEMGELDEEQIKRHFHDAHEHHPCPWPECATSFAADVSNAAMIQHIHERHTRRQQAEADASHVPCYWTYCDDNLTGMNGDERTHHYLSHTRGGCTWPKCQISFSTLNDYAIRAHLRRHANTPGGVLRIPDPCIICRFDLDGLDKQAKFRHYDQQHQKFGRYCPIATCHMDFVDMAHKARVEHIVTHNDEPKILCHVEGCGAELNHWDVMTRATHLASHGDARIICSAPGCGLDLSNYGTPRTTQHYATHAGWQPLCSVVGCGKDLGLSTEAQKIQHGATHHVQTDLCPSPGCMADLAPLDDAQRVSHRATHLNTCPLCGIGLSSHASQRLAHINTHDPQVERCPIVGCLYSLQGLSEQNRALHRDTHRGQAAICPITSCQQPLTTLGEQARIGHLETHPTKMTLLCKVCSTMFLEQTAQTLYEHWQTHSGDSAMGAFSSSSENHGHPGRRCLFETCKTKNLLIYNDATQQEQEDTRENYISHFQGHITKHLLATIPPPALTMDNMCFCFQEIDRSSAESMLQHYLQHQFVESQLRCVFYTANPSCQRRFLYYNETAAQIREHFQQHLDDNSAAAVSLPAEDQLGNGEDESESRHGSAHEPAQEPAQEPANESDGEAAQEPALESDGASEGGTNDGAKNKQTQATAAEIAASAAKFVVERRVGGAQRGQKGQKAYCPVCFTWVGGLQEKYLEVSIPLDRTIPLECLPGTITFMWLTRDRGIWVVVKTSATRMLKAAL